MATKITAANQRVTLTNNEKLGLISTMATMLTAGIPILETVESLTDDSKGNMRKVLEAVHADLMQGSSLSTSFARFPNVFDKVTVNIVKASEEAGKLDVVLKDLRSEIKKDMEFMDKVKSALSYPLVVFFVFIGIMLVILIVVIPKIGTVFKQLRVSLPLPTRVLIFASGVITGSPILFILGTFVFIAGFVVLFKTQRKAIMRVFYSFPVISGLIAQIDLTRFSRSMYLLLTSGLTITSALDLTKDIVLRADVSKSIAFAHEKIMAGEKLSVAFKQKKTIFPAIIIKIIEAGEKTGSLDKSMQDISEYMDYQVSNTLKTVTTLLEPLMLVSVGLLVGGMMLSIIAPIYGLISQVGAR